MENKTANKHSLALVRPGVRVHVGVVLPVELLHEGLAAELAVVRLLVVGRVLLQEVPLVLADGAEGGAALRALVVAVYLVQGKKKCDNV